MHNPEEEQLAGYKRMVDGLPVPLELLDAAILSGFDKAKREEKTVSRKKGRWFAVLAAAVLMAGFFTSVRLSPAFAGYVAEIPGLEKIVDLIRDDKGVIAALESKYDQKIGVSSTKDGITFTVDKAIADENGLVVFYTIKAEDSLGIEEAYLQNIKLESADGTRMVLGSSDGGNLVKADGDFLGKMDFFFQEPLKTRAFNLTVGTGGTTHSLTFKLNGKVYGKKDFKLNKTFDIEGQKLSIENVEMYPLRAAIHVKMDPGNTKRLLNYDNIRLIDERGETWNKITNGITMTGGPADDEKIIYLQSNYFGEPKELYLVIGKIQAVDKDEPSVIIDPVSKTILKQPKEGKYSGVKVEQKDILLIRMETKKEYHYFPFSTILDSDGKEVAVKESFKYDDKGYTEFGFMIPGLESYKKPLSLELSFFPAWIESQEKIRIK